MIQFINAEVAARSENGRLIQFAKLGVAILRRGCSLPCFALLLACGVAAAQSTKTEGGLPNAKASASVSDVPWRCEPKGVDFVLYLFQNDRSYLRVIQHPQGYRTASAGRYKVDGKRIWMAETTGTVLQTPQGGEEPWKPGTTNQNPNRATRSITEWSFEVSKNRLSMQSISIESGSHKIPNTSTRVDCENASVDVASYLRAVRVSVPDNLLQ